MIVTPDAEDRMIVPSFFWTKHRNVTDGQIDRQICCGCYSGRHWEQYGRAVNVKFHIQLSTYLLTYHPTPLWCLCDYGAVYNTYLLT